MSLKFSLPLFSVQPLFSVKKPNTKSLSFTKNENIFKYFQARENSNAPQVLTQKPMHVSTGALFCIHVEEPVSDVPTSIIASKDIPDEATTFASHDFSKPLSTKKRAASDSFLFESEVLGFAPFWQIQNLETKECVFVTGRDAIEIQCEGQELSQQEKDRYRDSSKFSIELLGHVQVWCDAESVPDNRLAVETNNGKMFAALWRDANEAETYANELKSTLEGHMKQLREKVESENASSQVDDIDEHVQHMNINDDEDGDEESQDNHVASSPQKKSTNESEPQEEDIVPLAEDKDEIESHLQCIRESEASIDTIAEHLHELVALTRREVNKALIFKMQGIELLLSLLQTRWKEDTGKITHPILSIIGNIALSQQNKHLAKLLDQEGVMEQLWLVLKLNIGDKSLVRSCLVTINLIGSQDGIMPLFAKHPSEIVILFSLVNKQNAHSDMRLILVVLQATAAATDYSHHAKQDSVFRLISNEILDQIYEFMHKFEYNQRLVLSALDIISHCAQSDVQQIDLGKFGSAVSGSIRNFKRDSMVLCAVLRALKAVNPAEPLKALDGETSTLLRNQAEILVKRDSSDHRPDTHCIPATLFDGVFRGSSAEKQE